MRLWQIVSRPAWCLGGCRRACSARRAHGVLLTACVCLWLGACGGRVEPDPDPAPQESSSAGNTGASGGSTSGSGQPEGTDGLDPATSLGKCPEGWDPAEADCPWLASNGLCYATKVDACSCICPRSNNTICSSGLPGGPDSRTWVSCD